MKDKKDIGNLHNGLNSGVDLDPDNKLSLHNDKEKGQQAYYKGQKIKYMDYIQEVGDRVKRNKEGKGADNMGLFQGVKFDTKGNINKFF